MTMNYQERKIVDELMAKLNEQMDKGHIPEVPTYGWPSVFITLGVVTGFSALVLLLFMHP